ncbi:MAG: keto-deoxy-phosphogluconate aldolase [Candidatus Sericytochromatia bacterium]|nr:keto-deoxy-phosphogluconate aldolase [Candidatus Sericytochromatia bacterium]
MDGGSQRQTVLRLWRQAVIMPVVRTPRPEQAVAVARALHAGGLTVLEVAWNCAGAAEVLAELRRWPGVTVGAGTLLGTADAAAALRAGAQFLVSPIGSLDVLALAHAADAPCALGAATPSEVWRIHQAGSDLIKLFPIAAMGGPQLIKDLREPFGRLPWLVSGSVTLDNAATYLDLGAAVLALGGALLPKDAVAAGDWAQIRHRTEAWCRWLQARFAKAI